MKSTLITGAAIVAALVVVLSTRVVVPALVFAFRVIEAGFAPEEPVVAKALPVAVAPVVDVSVPSAVVSVPSEQRQTKEDTIVSKPKRATRKRAVKKVTPLGDVLTATSVSTDVAVSA